MVFVRKQVSGNQAVQNFGIPESHSYPQPGHPRPAQEYFSFSSLAMPIKIANEINPFDLVEREHQVAALKVKYLHAGGREESIRVQITFDHIFIQLADNHLFEGRGACALRHEPPSVVKKVSKM